MDGQRFPTPSPQPYVEAFTCLGNVNDATFGSYAFANARLYLECEGHGIVSLSVDTAAPSFSICDATCSPPSWHTATSLTFGPPIVAGGLVWAVNNGSGLWAWNASTGVVFFQSSGFAVNRFVTPSEAGGQIFVPSGNVIRSFVVHTGAPQVAPVAPAPRASAAQVNPPGVGGRPPAPQVSPIPPLGR